MGEIINVIDLAKSIKGQIAEFVSQRANNGEIIPKIASIVVGEDGGSIFYINSQEKVANSGGELSGRCRRRIMRGCPNRKIYNYSTGNWQPVL